MSNRNRKATGGSTMVDKKLKKANEKIKNLQEQLGAANFQVLNLRSMYEGVVGEKQAIINQAQRLNNMLMAAVVQARGKKIVLRAATLKKLEDYAGVDTQAVDDDLIIKAVTREALEAMQEEIEELEEGDA